MKITELKCSACNGTLSVDATNPKIAVCDYCGTKYMLESEGSDNVHLGPRTEFMADTYYVPPRKSSSAGVGLRVFLVIVSFTVIICGTIAINIYVNSGTSNSSYTVYNESREVEVEEGTRLTGLLALFAGKVIEKPIDMITDEDLAKFTWLKITNSGDDVEIAYSYADPDAEDAELSRLLLSREDAGSDLESLPMFNGLKKLEVDSSLAAEELVGLQLESLTCYDKSLSGLADSLDDPGLLKELAITGGLESLDGLERFPGLTSLSIRSSYVSDISNLASLKNLKSLTIEYGDSIGDFSVLYVMTGLESLSLDSEAIKDFAFIRDMPNLSSFSLYDAKILNLNALEGKDSLQSLVIDGCRDLTDSSAVSGLTGLKHLSLELMYNAPDPDLNDLTELESLAITRMDTVKFLKNMSKLEHLQLLYCEIDDTSAFAGLVNLKTFQCSSPDYDTNWNFVANIPSLEIIKLNGVATYEDVSVLFNIPTLKEIYLNGMECELNFASLQPNESLEVIEMDGMKLYKNVKISGGGGITYVDYDSVILDENTGFFANYPNLRQLSIADNKLTNIAFADALVHLETMNISGNYVTDLKPLETLGQLSSVDCTGNPVENYRVLADRVMIIK